ncbi:hypothetical protein ACFQE1_07795 [Halobium palmae]|uniref:Uncharacterized protein n=1 Tax=Halobium palmae TaxID=1776492 RepID=A0ABD5RYC8_9EURY
MMWQDLVFLAGSVFSLLVLVPTLRDSMANVPLGTSAPSATLGLVYGATFFSLGMTLSAAGSLLTGVMWSAIAAIRSPNPLLDEGSDAPTASPPKAD